MMFIKHHAPNRCLEANSIDHWVEFRIAEMAQRQGEGDMYKEEVIVKRNKSQGGGGVVGVRVDVNGEVKLL